MKVVPLAGLVWLAAATAPVQITVSNVRNDSGHVLAAICSQADFLSMRCQFAGSAPARPGAVTISIAGVTPETYAIQAFHDENDNKKIDRNFFGIPTEGLGFSNNAAFRFGPPSFKDAAVSLGSSGAQIDIQLRYYNK